MLRTALRSARSLPCARASYRLPVHHQWLHTSKVIALNSTASVSTPAAAPLTLLTDIDAPQEVLLETTLETTPKTLTEEAKEKKRFSSIIKVGDYVDVFIHYQYGGIVVQQKTISGRLQKLSILTKSGKILEATSDNVAYSTTGFALPSNIKPYITNPVTFDPDAENITLPSTYSQAIYAYQRTLQHLKGTHMRKLDRIYSHFMSEAEPEEERIVSLQEIAEFVFEKPKPEELHITFLHGVADNVRFIPSYDMRTSLQWTLRSSEQAKHIFKLIEWIRTKSPEFTSFLNHTRPLVEFVHANANKDGTLSTSAQEKVSVYTDALTSTDKMLIQFVADWIKSPKIVMASPYEIFVPTLLKSLRCYTTIIVDQSLAVRFLQDVGMFKPWDNVGLLERADWMEAYAWTEKAKSNEAYMDTISDAFTHNNVHKMASFGLTATDNCDAIRHDFGDLPVYTIDDPSAKEIDDGISIEHVGTDTWLHVHIADPTTFIMPGQSLANFMQERAQTLYLPECHFPMMPDSLSTQKCSLGISADTASRGPGSQYAMSFSTKVDAEGNLLDWKVRPSIVSKVVKLTYDAVDLLLDPLISYPRDPLVDFSSRFSHPNTQSLLSSSTPIPKSTHKDILSLFHLLRQHTLRRERNGAIAFSRPSPVIQVDPNPLALPISQFETSVYASQIPSITLSLDKSGLSPARQLVAEAMIIGGRVASMYGHNHGLLLPYRAQQWSKNMSPEDMDLRDRMLATCRGGSLFLKEALSALMIMPPSFTTTEAGLPHVAMGIENGYCRATSPLRRYSDMIVHWQLKAHLLGDASVFSKEALHSIVLGVERTEKKLSLLQRKGMQFWVVELLRRLEEGGEKKTWKCMIRQPNMLALSELGRFMEVAPGTVLELGIQGRIIQLDRTVEPGEIVKVQIARLDPLSGRVDFSIVE
ncbi:hypothetical protein BDF14DRAFT_1763636 [Spinellus fusiger]|nr:hypothetical protein BDF14DRAFT_1763636 [Spinellus fusiger]